MSVVLRCPNCGTTQGHVGECDACSEGEVQYFCTNHDEGIWLDSPVCARCGAKFGDAPRKPAPAAVPPRPPRPAGAPDFRPPARPRAPERMAGPEFGRRPPRRAEPEEPAEGDVLPRAPSLGELLEEITEERARARERYDVEEAPAPPWGGVRVRGPGLPFVAGCLVRLLGLGFLLFVAFVIFMFLLFGGFIVD